MIEDYRQIGELFLDGALVHGVGQTGQAMNTDWHCKTATSRCPGKDPAEVLDTSTTH